MRQVVKGYRCLSCILAHDLNEVSSLDSYEHCDSYCLSNILRSLLYELYLHNNRQYETPTENWWWVSINWLLMEKLINLWVHWVPFPFSGAPWHFQVIYAFRLWYQWIYYYNGWGDQDRINIKVIKFHCIRKEQFPLGYFSIRSCQLFIFFILGVCTDGSLSLPISHTKFSVMRSMKSCQLNTLQM